MMQLAFCDDDTSILDSVCVLLDQYRIERNVEITYSLFHSPLELLAKMEKGMRFDILFLDVLMPGENGINVAKEIRQYDENVKIIFLTSSSDFAVQSYSVGAYFYQLKPLQQESFFKLMDSCIDECKKTQGRILIMNSQKGVVRIDLEKLKYCEVSGRTLRFYMENGKVLECSGNLNELCNGLAEYDEFFRPHRSYLVNMAHIQNISPREITMDDFTEIPIPHGKSKDVKTTYLEYAFKRKQLFI